MSATRYLVTPGWVSSMSDHQRHWINHDQLIRLYGVDRRECVLGREHETRSGLIRLHPRNDERYQRPDPDNAERDAAGDSTEVER